MFGQLARLSTVLRGLKKQDSRIFDTHGKLSINKEEVMKIKRLFLIVMMIAIYLLLMEGNIMSYQNENNQNVEQKMIRLEDLQWQKRVILVFTNENLDNNNSLYEKFQAQQLEIEMRDIRYFLFGKDILTNDVTMLDEPTVRELKSKYQLLENKIMVVLIGKDGLEKYRKTYLDFEEIFGIIDVMPMRQQEMTAQQASEKVLIDFLDADESGTWWIVNDGVMGGLSQSEFKLTGERTAIFQGNVSLENFGGFSSIRTNPRSFELENHQGLLVRVKGDGKKYQLRLYADNRFDDIAYQAYFQTKPATWLTIRAPFSEFVPVFRGRIINNFSPISPEKIKAIGFMISDKQAGPFKLEIDSIRAYQ